MFVQYPVTNIPLSFIKSAVGSTGDTTNQTWSVLH